MNDVEKLVRAIDNNNDDKAKKMLSKVLKKKCADKIARDLDLDKPSKK